MAVVRIQARALKGGWDTLAQLEHTEAQGYIDCVRSQYFLEAVERNMRLELESRLKAGKIKQLPSKIEATHLRTIRQSPDAFRVVRAWVPGDTVEEDLRKQEASDGRSI